jgi:hypothetical protein
MLMPPILQFSPSLVFPMADGEDSREMEHLFSEMYRELNSFVGWPVTDRLHAAVDMALERWRQRLDQFAPGIQFSKSVEGGRMRIDGFIAPPKYVLLFRSKL